MNITDAGLEPLQKLSLESLSLTLMPISDAGVRHLSQMPLERLDLARTRVTDACLPGLTGMPLQSLNLCGTRVTSPGLRVLSPMKGLGLIISREQFSPASVENLEAAGVRVFLQDRVPR